MTTQNEEMMSKMDELIQRQTAERAALSREIYAPIIDTVCRLTEEWADEYDYNKSTEKPKLSEKAQEVVDFLRDTDFGCHRTNVRRLVGVLLGEELPEDDNSQTVEFRPGVAVVPLARTNGHNYALKTPAIVHSTSGQNAQCLSEKWGWGEGNHMAYRRSELRPATPDEIAALVGILGARDVYKEMSFLRGLVPDTKEDK